jgi:hypothetical protein
MKSDLLMRALGIFRERVQHGSGKGANLVSLARIGDLDL